MLHQSRIWRGAYIMFWISRLERVIGPLILVGRHLHCSSISGICRLTGILANAYPSASVVGTDLSPIQPEWFVTSLPTLFQTKIPPQRSPKLPVRNRRRGRRLAVPRAFRLHPRPCPHNLFQIPPYSLPTRLQITPLWRLS